MDFYEFHAEIQVFFEYCVHILALKLGDNPVDMGLYVVLSSLYCLV